MDMAGSKIKEVLDALQGSAEEYEGLLKAAGEAEADAAADLILQLNTGELKIPPEVIERLLSLAESCTSDKLRTVVIGTLWREDLTCLDKRLTGEETARERLLQIVAGDDPKALAPVFWRAVAEKGPRFALIAFRAAMNTHEIEAARLLVGICRASISGQLDVAIREAVDGFLEGRDPSVRSAFLDAMKRVPELERRKIMTQLDMSLMAELDRSAIEHRGSGFGYDEAHEQAKRDSKSKDIFDEVRRRLERGEKPQL